MDFKKFLGSPAERCEAIFGQKMEPCPKCGGYNIRYQTPIKHDEPLPDDLDPKKILGVYARAYKNGPPMLEGPSYICCFDCFHKGPAVDCSGRTSEDVGKDPKVCAEIKMLWNDQRP